MIRYKITHNSKSDTWYVFACFITSYWDNMTCKEWTKYGKPFASKKLAEEYIKDNTEGVTSEYLYDHEGQEISPYYDY